MFDTHTHLNFTVFKKNLATVINQAQMAGVTDMTVVGTTLANSARAVDLAQKYPGLVAAVGLHPHHVFGYVRLEPLPAVVDRESALKSEPEQCSDLASLKSRFTTQLAALLESDQVVAVGETGLDFHHYQRTKYTNYQLTPSFKHYQEEFFRLQLQLASEFKKSLVIHNREATEPLLDILEEKWDQQWQGKLVFHCVEPDQRLLDFALSHKCYVGVTGQVTFDVEVIHFLHKIPLRHLVLETDCPFFKPQLRSNEHLPSFDAKNSIAVPFDIKTIAETVASLKKVSPAEVQAVTTANARHLFAVS